MAARSSLGKISEEGMSAAIDVVKESNEIDEEEKDTMGEENEVPKERRLRKTKSRKKSVFSPDMKAKHQEKASFALIHNDQPLGARVTFAPSQSDSSDYSGRRTSGHENIALQRHNHRATFQTGPRKEFSVSQVQKIIQETIENGLAASEIKKQQSVLSRNLAEAIKIKIRRLNYDRYRIIVNVFICTKDNVTLKITSRCVWDENIDNYADYLYEAEDFYVLGIAYGVYKE